MGICWRKRPTLWPDKWILHHDNAPVYYALRVHEFLAKKSIIKVDHPLYSSDLDPCDFWFLPKLKNSLKGKDLLPFLTSTATLRYCEVFWKTIFKMFLVVAPLTHEVHSFKR
jgi:hypothetical protein